MHPILSLFPYSTSHYLFFFGHDISHYHLTLLHDIWSSFDKFLKLCFIYIFPSRELSLQSNANQLLIYTIFFLLIDGLQYILGMIVLSLLV